MKEKAAKTPTSPPSTLSSLWLFFGLVFCWTWFFWILAAALGISAQSAFGIVLEVLGLLGPMLGGIGFAYLTLSKESWLEYWSRMTDPKRIQEKWYLVIFLFVPGLMAVAVLLDVAPGGSVALLIKEKVTIRAVDNCSLPARRVHLRPVSRRIGLASLCPRSVASKVECAGVDSDSGRDLGIMAPAAVLYQRYPLL
jgi:hypothetical protein